MEDRKPVKHYKPSPKTSQKPRLQPLLGKIVTIEIDRPLGSAHPKHPNLIYPLNYGYLPGVIGGDGEPQDVYLMGVDQPVERMECVIIGIVKRLNDSEDKLVAAPVGMIFHQAQIAEAVRFQERYFQTRIIPLYHRSCGAILYRKDRNIIRYLLLFQRGSHTWSFPKGHMELLESEEETALREVMEEVGMAIHLCPNFRGEATYPVGVGQKTVVLFLAEAPRTPIARSQEVLTTRWISLREAEKLLHSSYLEPLRAAEWYLLHSNNNS